MILVDIYVPSLNQKYDFKLNENVYVAEILDELDGMMITDESDKKADFLLCSYETNKIFPQDRTLKQMGVGNGSCLVLI